MPERPSFVVFMTDQQRADHAGFGGNTILQTPNLDALAARGMVFDRTYVATPICMPNRSSILTGRMPSAHGTRYNGIPLDWDINTFVRRLRAAGYRTGLVGKAHFQNLGDRPDYLQEVYRGHPREEGQLRAWPQGWDRYELQARYRQEDVEIPPNFYGFDYADLAVNHADYVSGHYLRWLMSHGVNPETMTGPGNAAQVADEWWQIYKPQLPVDLYPTSYIAMRAQEFITDAARGEQPFFLLCSFPDPHHPFTPPGGYWDMYSPGEMPLPETFWDAHERSVPHVANLAAQRGTQTAGMAPFAPTPVQYRRAVAAEYGALSLIDTAIGDVLATVSRHGLGEHTTTMFTSDHGDMFGDHGVMLKGRMHYEACVRVPLAIAGPGIAPGRTRSLASSLDLAPTILDLAGVAGYEGIQGASLRPLLSGAASSVRDAVYIEEDAIAALPVTGRPPRMRTIITDEGRLTRYLHADFGEVFATGSDPWELDNRYAQPGGHALQDRLSEQLFEQMLSHTDHSRHPTHMA
jgi:arylsulfatase A-like enzyme